uniref:protein-serine/threonine phosphatase n=1 Tax=Fagus sylvatica TaxID=28930 RepID=A0A2N9H401_FAGSY
MSFSDDFPLHSYSSEHDFIASLNDSFQSLTFNNNNNNNASALSEPKPKPKPKSSDHRRTKKRSDSDEYDACGHPEIQDNKCTHCKKKLLDDNFGVSFSYVRKGLRLSHKEIARLRDVQSHEKLKNKKLVLVLDLDQTLIHVTTLLDKPTSSKAKPSKTLKDQFILNSIQKTVKLRPFRTAISQRSEYDVRVYFGSRIISRDDSPRSDQKSLDLVLAPERMVLVLDDTEEVWMNHKPNLVSIERYNYFGSMVDESETECALVKSLRVLKLVHGLFFHKKLEVGLVLRDVRVILRSLRGEVLKGCNLFFSDLGSENGSRLCAMAEELGAMRGMELEESVTHVVSLVVGSEECRWAEQEKKFLVHPSWVELAYYMFERMPEQNFLISLKKFR